MDSTPQAPQRRTGASADDGSSRAEAPIHSRLSLFTDTAEPAQPYLVSSSEGGAGRAPVPRMSRWTQRIFLVIFVIFCIELGMLLVVLPWLPVWTSNGLLARFPGLRELAAHNFVRGAMSGMGLLDIWIGIWEAVHYREK